METYFERFLLICGMPDAGKSRLVRAMFDDPRLGGPVAAMGPIATRALSRERCLGARVTSPHEYEDTLAEFAQRTRDLVGHFRRANFITPVQPVARNSMPSIDELCAFIISEFEPERVRLVSLCPDVAGETAYALSAETIDKLRGLDVEYLTIDARSGQQPAEPGNIRILADFFDFS